MNSRFPFVASFSPFSQFFSSKSVLNPFDEATATKKKIVLLKKPWQHNKKDLATTKRSGPCHFCAVL